MATVRKKKKGPGKKKAPSGENEVTWTRETLKPLLLRLGFWKVDFTHGPNETGRDLVLGDVDRFGVPIYLAAQVKDEIRARRGGAQLEEVIAQLKTALSYIYPDPTTGLSHRMAGVYLIVKGSITDQAKNRLHQRVAEAGWLRIISGDQLQAAEHIGWARTVGEDFRMRVGLALGELEVTESGLTELHAAAVAAAKTISSHHMASAPVDLNWPFRPCPTWALDQAIGAIAHVVEGTDVTQLYIYRTWVTGVVDVRAFLRMGKYDGHESALLGLVDSISKAAAGALKRLPVVRTILRGLLDTEPPMPGQKFRRFSPPDPLLDGDDDVGHVTAASA